MEWLLLERFLCGHLGPIARQLDGIELLLLFRSQQHIWMKNDALTVGRIEASSVGTLLAAHPLEAGRSLPSMRTPGLAGMRRQVLGAPTTIIRRSIRPSSPL